MTDKSAKMYIPTEEGQLSLLLNRGGPRSGAGRKRIGQTKKVSVTLPEELWEAFEHKVEAARSTKSEVIRAMIERYMKHDSHEPIES
ncbi:ribbon-helix-helix domain-containing protein [Paenibacillus sp. HJGM_3]|uniref:ribbon-helix-helix domain-containing protein n=1 Tax=Paenibacillus sp. HJGM_3 TaxID=3379816 RepID=UPI00385F10F3